ncbi:MAG: RraA family protein [Alphaproteobacteria bacterium]|nr:RraA family protein [Alphaproteobacteria bacterium]
MAARKKTTADLADRLLKCYASAVHDVLKGMGHGNCVLPSAIRPLDPKIKVAGEIYTISGRVDRTLSKHETLLRWARVLSKVPAGKVIVCQPNTYAIALMGELSARALMVKKTRGYVVDGACRDTDFILDMRFPVFCTHNTPADIVETWTPDEHLFGEPVTIGTVTIGSGDYLLGDRDGVVVLPKEKAAEAVAETERVVSTESDMRKSILAGMDPEKAYLKYGKF